MFEGAEIMGDKTVVVCNYEVATSMCSQGALAYVGLVWIGGGCQRLVIRVRTRSGRWVTKWESIKRLINFRFKTLPPDHPRYSDVENYYGDDMPRYLSAAKQFHAEGRP